MIFAEDLTKHFDDFVAVDGINLNVHSGEVMVLLGPNGAGKTTTVRMLTSILKPTRGRAVVAGYDVVNQAKQVRSVIGVLTEHHGLYGRMNAREYLEFYGSMYGLSSQITHRYGDELLVRFGLTNVGGKRLGEYSKGMRQKLALVRALLHDPPVLLLDEPTSAMDPESSRMVRDAISSLRSNDRTIILCTHNLAEADELADQVAIIRNGHILMSGTPADLKKNLLGPSEYEAYFVQPPDGWQPVLPAGVDLVERGHNWLRFQVTNPEYTNPLILRQLVDSHLDLISFHELPRSLERAYLEAVSRADGQVEEKNG